MTHFAKALLTIGLVWAIVVAWQVWAEANRQVTYCAFGSCTSPVAAPFDWGRLLGHVAVVTAIAAVLVAVAAIWLRRPGVR